MFWLFRVQVQTRMAAVLVVPPLGGIHAKFRLKAGLRAGRPEFLHPEPEEPFFATKCCISRISPKGRVQKFRSRFKTVRSKDPAASPCRDATDDRRRHGADGPPRV